MTQESYHYALIARAIDLIDGAETPLSLEDLAQAMQMSPGHFQRVFSQWVGISPKRYQQYLALDHAKHLLRERFTTLATADAVGLSGSGRLHDMFLTWEAMRPGDFAKGGAGLSIRWGWFESPFGPALFMGTARGICGLAFAETADDPATMADMTKRWPAATYVADRAFLKPWVDAALGRTPHETAPLYLIGAPLQIKVWEALLQIPTGQVSTYSEIADHIGHPRAVRAVGTAVGRNPISWLIPCHRALRKSGALGGYHLSLIHI